MASILKKVALPVANSRTAFFTAAADKQTIVITGTVANTDTTTKATHFVTIEVFDGSSYKVVVKDAPVPYGGSLELPKIVMEEGDIMNMSADLSGVLEGYISYVEKD